MYVTATKSKGNPDIVRGVDFVQYSEWVTVSLPEKFSFRSSILFTLNFSAN